MRRSPQFLLISLVAIILMATFPIFQNVFAQSQNTKPQKEESFTRPAPTKPIKPEIPEANRYQDDKVFLEYADSLYRPPHEYEEFQIVKGSVKFRHGGMWMFCDSAYYYPQKNSMDAFGNVEMQQGDTLFVYADKLYYDGMSKHATLVRGPSRDNVELKNREVTLTTDSLDYDMISEMGWYTTGGILRDEVNDLTSVYGEYSPSTKQARFRNDVVLVNREDGYRLTTEELDYNTATHIADINTLTRIEGENDTIVTTKGWYNTMTDRAELTERSIIMHRDSNMNVTTLEGDSIIYDKLTRISRAFMFRDRNRLPHPMVITDTARKVTLIGGYGEYNDSTRFAFATDYPLMIEYSRPDSLFLRADTIVSFIETIRPLDITVHNDTVYDSSHDVSDSAFQIIERRDTVVLDPKDYHVGRAIGRARFFNKDIQGVADTLLIKEVDSILYMIRKPIVWSGAQQVYGNRINIHFNDSTADWALLPESGMAAEHIEEDFYQQLTGSKMLAFFGDETLTRLEVEGNVVAILLPQENDSSYNKLVNAESSYLTLDMEDNKVKHLKMWPEVSGTVTPLFDVKQSQKYIEGFRWFEQLRPVREWYGDSVRWMDELGEVPEALEIYFEQPPLFRTVAPPTAGRQLQKPNLNLK